MDKIAGMLIIITVLLFVPFLSAYFLFTALSIPIYAVIVVSSLLAGFIGIYVGYHAAKNIYFDEEL